jgi:ribosomal RNA assembly protein
MEHILIPEKRAESLSKIIKEVSKVLNCRLEIVDGNNITVTGEAYDEYNARNVIQAYGRGFDINDAYKLLGEEIFFKFTDLKDFFRNDEQRRRIRARMIGREGKTKLYIEEISGAKIAIYGNTIGMIGTVEQLRIASAALQVLVEGGTHKKAYNIMERMRRSAEAR